MRRLLGALFAGAAITLCMAPIASAEPPPELDSINQYPLASGRFDSPDAFYWKFFKTSDGRACGIGPNGQLAGCDAAPSDAPPGTTQTVVSAGNPGYYRFSDTKTFTRDVDTLPAGRRLENWGVSCAVDEQEVVTCQTYGQHGFRIAERTGTLW